MHNTGKFNKRITFRRIVQQADALGDHPVPENVKTVWASVRAARGGEYYEAQKLRPEKSFVINCRYFLVDDEEVAAEGAGRGVAQATKETLGCGAVLLVLRYVALELQPRVRGKATFRTLEKRLVPFGGRDWRAIAGVRSGPHSTDWSFQMVHLKSTLY